MARPPRTSLIAPGEPVAGLRAQPQYDGRVAKLIELLGPGQDLAWTLTLPNGQDYRSQDPDPRQEPKQRSTLRLYLNNWTLLRGPVNSVHARPGLPQR